MTFSVPNSEDDATHEEGELLETCSECSQCQHPVVSHPKNMITALAIAPGDRMHIAKSDKFPALRSPHVVMIWGKFSRQRMTDDLTSRRTTGATRIRTLRRAPARTAPAL
jgi:hypothetical protein